LRNETGNKHSGEMLRAVGTYTGHGIQLTLITLIFFYAGWKLDGFVFGTHNIPVFTLVLTFAGGAAAFYRMYRILLRQSGKGNKESEADSRE
jgi:hypothetical protein